jgi:hypothetical protein
MKPKKVPLFESLPEIRIDNSMEFPTNPFFEKKRLDAIEFLKNHPIPDHILKRSKKEESH